MEGSGREEAPARPWTVPVIVGGIVLLAAIYVGFSLQRPEPPTFSPTPVEPRPAGEELVGPRTVTVDASVPHRWVFFSFDEGSVVEDPGPTDWDLAFRRFTVITNGGDGFHGVGGALDLGEVPFDSVTVLPTQGYQASEAVSDSANPVLERWYDYSLFSHLLSPQERVYGIRTADGRYAKIQILGYYCVGAVPGCLTFRYVYQGGGGPDLTE